MEDLSWEYITYARHLVTTDSYSKAFNLFLRAFERNPSLIPTHEAEFRGILLRLNSILAESNKSEIIFENFSRAIRIYPQNVHILNDIGKYLYKYNLYKQAWEQFEKALKINPNLVNAEKNLNSIKDLLVERWHFRMLNDHIRNEYYRQAIRSTVNPETDIVLDVGTGTGLLAIYAREAGATKVLGCDGSDIMSEMAERIVCKNKLKNIRIINNMSTSMNLWKTGGKSTLLLTEMFDAGLFGEHVLQMLSHAWPSLLTPNAQVIPNCAEFFVVGVECDYLNRKYQLSPEAKALINISGVHVHVLTHDTYDSEDVHLMPNIKYVTEPASVINVNFNDLNNIEEILKQIDPFTVEMKAKLNGEVNVMVGWFNLYLSDIYTITTNPRADDRANAWQHAIFFDMIPRPVKVNETFKTEFYMNGGKLRMETDVHTYISRVSPEIIRFLNDMDYLKMINGCIGMACVYLGQIAEMSQISVADLCPFPFFGLQMLKRGARSLLCAARNEHDKEFIIDVFNENKVSLANVTIVYGDDWTPDIFGEEKYHAIFTHSLEICGDIDLRLKEIAVHMREARLLPGGLFMPAKMHIVGQLVSCHWLDINNKLYDENVSNYKMSTIMNKYQVTQNFCIDFSLLKFVPITNPVVICPYPNGLRFESAVAPVVTDGHANAILCWYTLELMDDMKEISTNRPGSLIDGMLFLTNSRQALVAGAAARIAQHKDMDGGFKLALHVEEEAE